MSCLHPYSDSSLRLSSHLIIIFCLVLYLLPMVAEGAQPQNVSLEFPVFNSTMFSCTGIPSIVAYPYCVFNSSGAERAWVSVLPPTYNNIYPNQAARMMYKTPISFRNADSSIIADWSTFMIFTVEQVVDQLSVGSGLAFLIAPEIDTPTDSASGGFGLFPMNPSTGQPVSGTKPMVIAVEFDTQMTDGIDVLDVPHLGIDLSSLVSVNATTVGTDFYDHRVGIWVDYNNTLKTLAVYCTQVDAADGTAAALKPSTPTLSLSSFSSVTYVNQQAYIGISAGVFGGGFEVNKVVYWTFKTFGFPAPVVVATWYQWWKGVSTTKKMGLIAGAVVGTIAGAYACSECLFFCFFQRIKHPATAAEQRWPVRRRTSLPGTKPKKEPPRRKVRDSLSVAKPLHLWSTPPGSDGEPAVDFTRRPESDLKAMAEFDDLSDSEGSEHAAQAAFNDFGDLGLPLDQSLDEHVQDPAAVGTPEEAEKPGKAEAAPPPGSSPAAEVKARPPVAEKPGKAEEAPEKKPEAQAGTKTDTKDKPLIEKKPSQPGEEAPAPSATKVPPGAVNPSSPSKPRPVPSAEKPGAPRAENAGAKSPAEKPGAPPVAKPGSPPQQRPSQAPKTVAAQAAKPGSPPQEKPSQAGKTVAPQAAKPVLPQERPSQAPGNTVAPQAPKPGSPPLPQRSSQVGKTVAPQPENPGSAPQERPSPTGKTVAPPATKPGSPPQEKPAPVDKKMAPQTAKPGSPQVAKPDSPPQEQPGKTVAPQATKPGSEPQHRPSPVDKTAAPQAAKPGSPPEQHKPSQPGKTAAPQATKPGSPLMPGPWQGEKAKPEAGPQKVAPQAVKQTPPPAGATVAQQKSPPQEAGPSQVPRKELPKAPRPSPQTSPPKAASPQTSPKAVPRPTPQSPPRK